MKYSSSCGHQVEDDASFCPSCGGSLDAEKEVKVVEKGPEYSAKSKTAAGILQIFFGSLGIGRFYSGHTGIAVAQLLVSLFTCGAAGIWGFVDGIMILCSAEFKDGEGKIMK